MLRHALAVRGGLGVCAFALVACQPVDDEVDLDQPSPTPDGDPAVSVTDLDGLLQTTETAAGEWDADARLVELSVSLEEGEPVSGRATYVAPDAARLLVVDVSEGSVDEQQPTAETLGFEPVPGDALGEVPTPPGDLVEPRDVPEAASDVLDACGVDDAREVLYATGAPAAWDGSSWADSPEWRVTVLDDEGEGAVLDHDGTPRSEPCIDVGQTVGAAQP